MELSASDRLLLAALADGLPLLPRPFAALGEKVGITEAEVIERLRALREAGVINRFGLIVRHAELGYAANAMVVLDVADRDLERAGQSLAREAEIALCYARPRRLPLWSYNLFCMVFGRERAQTLGRIEAILARCGLVQVPHAILFSRRRFVQRAARYAAHARQVPEAER